MHAAAQTVGQSDSAGPRFRRAHFDKPLIVALRRAHRELSARGLDVYQAHHDLSEGRGPEDAYLRRIARLTFLAPDIQHPILTRRQAPGLTLKRVVEMELTPDWNLQRVKIGFAANYSGSRASASEVMAMGLECAVPLHRSNRESPRVGCCWLPL